MFLFREQKENELSELLIQAYQLNRNELIARVQQRDQYIICIIGAIVAMLVGLFEVSTNDNPDNTAFLSWILIGCLVVWIALVMLTYRFFNSYHIHNLLIEHTKNIERTFSERHTTKLEKYKLELWQTFVDNKLPNHRPNSYTYTASFFIFLNFVLLLAWSYIGTIETIGVLPMSIDIHNIPVFAISTASAIATVTNIYLWGNNILDPKGVLIPKLIKRYIMRVNEILLFFLPLLIAFTACLLIIGFNLNAIFPQSPQWIPDCIDVLFILFIWVSEYLVSKTANIFYEQEDNNNATLNNYTVLINYTVAFCFVGIFYIWITKLKDAPSILTFGIILIALIWNLKKLIPQLRHILKEYLLRFGKYIISFIVIIFCYFVGYLNNIMLQLQAFVSDVSFGVLVGVSIPSAVILGLHFIYKRFSKVDNSTTSYKGD